MDNTLTTNKITWELRMIGYYRKLKRQAKIYGDTLVDTARKYAMETKIHKSQVVITYLLYGTIALE